MLDRVPELALLVCDSLPLQDVANLARVNRTLLALCRPRLFRSLKLSSGDPWTDDAAEQEKQDRRIEDKVDSLILLASDNTLKLVKRVTVVGCEWTASKEGGEKLGKLLERIKPEAIEFVHRGGTTDEKDVELWSPLWPVLADTSAKEVELFGRPRPQQAWGTLVIPRDFPSSTLNSKTLNSALPSSLTNLTLSGVQISDPEDEGSFPAAVFRDLKKLTLVELYRPLLDKVGQSFKTFCAETDTKPPLQQLHLDCHPECEVGSGTWSVSHPVLLDFFASFKDALLLSLTIGSTGVSSMAFIPLMMGLSSGVPIGIRAAPGYEAEHVKELTSSISSAFPSLRDLTLRVDPRSEE
ncbi:hypothetical protein JCM6882_004099 [Rhodosporidiobolus microsporus]